MNKGYIKDHADRTWCRDPYSVAWRDAFVKDWHAFWGSVPNTPDAVRTCPFCGGHASKERISLNERYGYADKVVYTCTKCGCSRGAMGDTKKTRIRR